MMVPDIVHLHHGMQVLFTDKVLWLSACVRGLQGRSARGRVGCWIKVLQVHRLYGAWWVWILFFSCRYPTELCLYQEIINTPDGLVPAWMMLSRYRKCSRRFLEAPEAGGVRSLQAQCTWEANQRDGLSLTAWSTEYCTSAGKCWELRLHRSSFPANCKLL
jgi:hypothetical protein